jgi:hypothetical protein
LYNPDTDDNLGSPEIDTLETVLVSRTFFGDSLHLIGVLNHRYRLIDVEA